MKAIVILPTYNEKKNIEILIPKLQDVFKQVKKHKFSILVVDDNSPDGTADVVKKYKKRYKNLYLISGEKKGLGEAYLRAFKHVLKHYNFDVVIMMDADLSHDYRQIPEFLDYIAKGYDYVLASRYVKQGSVGFNLFRKMISSGGNFIARTITGINVRDITSGYKAIKVNLLRKIVADKFYPKGYAFQLSLLNSAIKNKAKIIEIPTIFPDRKHGHSKLSYKDIPDFIKECVRIRLKK